jgi:uncharacterized protein
MSTAIAPVREDIRKLAGFSKGFVGEVRYKTGALVVKEADAATGVSSGYAGVTGNRDGDGEVIDQGAFKSTIAQSKGIVPVLWQHIKEQPVAWGTEATEDGHGLRVSFQLLMNSELGRYAFEFVSLGLKLKAKVGLSVGFRVIKSSFDKAGVLHYEEVELLEYSIVTFPANKQAMVDQIKSGYQMEITKAARTKRVAGVDLPPSSFAYVGDPERTETWKLPISFPGDEEKTKSHIRNALARFSSTQGIPDGEKAKVLAKIKAAAKAHGIDKDEKGDHVAETVEVIKAPAKGFDEALADHKREEDLEQERWGIERAKSAAVQSAYEDPDMDNDERVAHIRKAHDGYGAAMTDWHQKNLDAFFGDNNDANTQDEEHPGAKDPGAAGKALSRLSVVMKARNAGHVARLKAAHELGLAALGLHRKCMNAVGDIAKDMGGNGGDAGSGLDGDGDGMGVSNASEIVPQIKSLAAQISAL